MDSNLGGIPGAAGVAGFLANQIGNGFRLAGQIPRMLKNTPRALVSNPKRLLNPFSARGGLLYGTGIQALGPSLGLDQETINGLDILAGGTSIVNLPFLLKGGDQNQDPDAKARKLGYADAADQVEFGKEMKRRQSFIGPPSPDFIGPRVPDYAQASYNARVSPSVDSITADVEPSQEPPSAPETLAPETLANEAAAVEEVKNMLLSEGATNYQDFTKDEINAEYDRLRKTDPEEAVRWGKDVNSILFGWY